MFYLVEDFREFFAEEIKARKESEEKSIKEAKEKWKTEGTFFKKNFTFGKTLLIVWLSHLVTTPIFFVLAYKLFG